MVAILNYWNMHRKSRKREYNRMIKIKDIDEKKMIIDYYKLGSNRNTKNILNNSSVYSTWLERWRDDFTVNGKCLQMFRQRFVVSANKDRKKIEPPEYYNDYNSFINSVTHWMNANYDKKIGRKNNRKKIGDILMGYREECALNLIELIKNSKHFSDCELKYHLYDKSRDKVFMQLVKYTIIHNDSVIYKGTYDEVKEFINNMDGFVGNKIDKA